MAFTTLTPTSFQELISQAVSFAASSLGWSGSSGSTIVPKPGGASFLLESGGAVPAGDTDRGFHIRCTVTEGARSFVATVDTMPGISQCWLFGGNTPEPWLHIVISSAPGDYHHLYLGYLERYGDWTGGAVADGTFWTGGTGSSSENNRANWASGWNHMLFSWDTTSTYTWTPNGRQPGGVLVNHAQAPVQPGRFTGSTTTSAGYPRDLGQFRVRGGVTDIGNRGLVIPGLTSFNGVQPLAPFVLRADFEYDNFETPLGAVAGVRMTHMGNLNPEDLLDFGGRTFQVFPLANKFRATSVSGGSPWVVQLPAYRQGGSEYMGIAVLRE